MDENTFQGIYQFHVVIYALFFKILIKMETWSLLCFEHCT